MSSPASPLIAKAATRSLIDTASLEWLEVSLPALLRRSFPNEWRLEVADMDVMLVVADIDAESLELGVPV